MLLKETITAGDIEDIDIIMKFGEVYRNSISVTLSNCTQNYGVRGLNYNGIERYDQIPDIHYDYYEDNNGLHHYIANLPTGDEKHFCGDTIDEAWSKCDRYFSLAHDSRIAPDGTKGDIKKFLLDALSGELHGLELQLLSGIKNEFPHKTKYASSYFNPTKKHKYKRRHR